MDKEVKKKKDFIVSWFNKERFGMKFPKQVKLAKTWIDICIQNEEYEMAHALTKELEKVRVNYFKLKNKNRTLSYKIKFHIKKFVRNVKRFKFKK